LTCLDLLAKGKERSRDDKKRDKEREESHRILCRNNEK
jgi:hypothetical protein